MSRIFLMLGPLALVVIGVAAVVLNAPSGSGDRATEVPRAVANDAPLSALVYHDPNCGCCGEYIAYLRELGVDVRVETSSGAAMTDVKSRYGIDVSMQSCHTMEIGGYAVEGHVPLEAIEALLAERPAVRGIALPGMPAGSPGMGGDKAEPFVIYGFTSDGESVYVTL